MLNKFKIACILVGIPCLVGISGCGTLPIESITSNSSSIPINNQTDTYIIKAQVPQVQELGELVNQKVQGVAQNIIEQFKKDVKDWNKDLDSQNYDESQQRGLSGLTLTYTLATVIPHKIVSGIFKADVYMATAAHPTYYYKAFNYKLSDTNSVEEISFADLFKHDSNYLQKISRLANLQLTQQEEKYGNDGVDIRAIKFGAAPRVENFKNFTITSSSLVIFFDDGAVAPHALGEQKVVIPWGDLVDVLDTQGPIKMINRL